MPSPTFFNLPDAKRQRLMAAIWQEFTTYSYIDASINRIVQTAAISRGSFYQYFSGKQDVFSYMLCTILEKTKAMFLAQLTVHSNDLFSAVLGMYELMLWKQSRGKPDPAITKIQTLIKLNAELDMSIFTEHLDHRVMEQGMMDLMSQAGYFMASPLECSALVHMLAAITLSNLTDTMRRPGCEAHNRAILEQQLELIRSALESRKATL